jgi:hypothetical protein
MQSGHAHTQREKGRANLKKWLLEECMSGKQGNLLWDVSGGNEYSSVFTVGR